MTAATSSQVSSPDNFVDQKTLAPLDEGVVRSPIVDFGSSADWQRLADCNRSTSGESSALSSDTASVRSGVGGATMNQSPISSPPGSPEQSVILGTPEQRGSLSTDASQGQAALVEGATASTLGGAATSSSLSRLSRSELEAENDRLRQQLERWCLEDKMRVRQKLEELESEVRTHWHSRVTQLEAQNESLQAALAVAIAWPEQAAAVGDGQEDAHETSRPAVEDAEDVGGTSFTVPQSPDATLGAADLLHSLAKHRPISAAGPVSAGCRNRRRSAPADAGKAFQIVEAVAETEEADNSPSPSRLNRRHSLGGGVTSMRRRWRICDSAVPQGLFCYPGYQDDFGGDSQRIFSDSRNHDGGSSGSSAGVRRFQASAIRSLEPPFMRAPPTKPKKPLAMPKAATASAELANLAPPTKPISLAMPDAATAPAAATSSPLPMALVPSERIAASRLTTQALRISSASRLAVLTEQQNGLDDSSGLESSGSSVSVSPRPRRPPATRERQSAHQAMPKAAYHCSTPSEDGFPSEVSINGAIAAAAAAMASKARVGPGPGAGRVASGSSDHVEDLAAVASECISLITPFPRRFTGSKSIGGASETAPPFAAGNLDGLGDRREIAIGSGALPPTWAQATNRSAHIRNGRHEVDQWAPLLPDKMNHPTSLVEAFGGFYTQLVQGTKCTGPEALAGNERLVEIDLSAEFPPERRVAQVDPHRPRLEREAQEHQARLIEREFLPSEAHAARSARAQFEFLPSPRVISPQVKESLQVHL